MLRFIANIFRKIKRDQQGFSETMLIVYALLIFMIFAVMYVDLYGYFYTKDNLKQAVDETLTLMKFENGFDQGTISYFNTMASKLGLNASAITLNGTPKTVQRGDIVELTASLDYEVKGLKPLNYPIKINITVRAEGLAHNKIR